MKLYYSKGACSLTQHILLELSGLKYEVESVDLRSKVTQSGKDFYQINPRGQVPTLVLEDGTVLLENIAIAQYIADKVPEKELLAPINHIDRYQAIAWISYVATDLHKAYGPLFHSQDEVVRSEALSALAEKLKMLNERLSQRKFIATDKLSIADAYLYVVLSWRKLFKTLPDYPHLDRYCSEIEQLEAVKKARSQEK